MNIIKNKILVSLVCLAGTVHTISAWAPEEGKLYEIRSEKGLLLDNQDSGDSNAGIFIAKPVDGSTAQVWQFVPVENRTDVYCIISPVTGMAIDNGGKGEKECDAIIWPVNPDNRNQHWRITETGNGYVTISSDLTGFNLGSSDAAPVGEPVRHRAATGSIGQIWKITPSAVKIKNEAFRTSSDKEWENERIFAINKEPGHSTFIPYANTSEMTSDPAYSQPWERTNSSRLILLNGKWKFNWEKQPEDRPADFYKPGYNITGWEEISFMRSEFR